MVEKLKLYPHESICPTAKDPCPRIVPHLAKSDLQSSVTAQSPSNICVTLHSDPPFSQSVTAAFPVSCYSECPNWLIFAPQIQIFVAATSHFPIALIRLAEPAFAAHSVTCVHGLGACVLELVLVGN